MKSLLMLALFFSTLVFAQVRPGPVPNPGPGAPIPPIPVDFPVSTLCKKTCANNVQSLTFMTITSQSGTRNCPDTVTMQQSCAPYACAPTGGVCKTNCAANTDCAAGFACINGQCGTISYYCSDFSTATGTDGKTYDCAPYACQAGQCIKRCGTTNDCVPGTVCDIGAGLCVVPTPN